MIDLEFFDSVGSTGILKATVHKTGKLGFNSGASKFMKLDTVKFFSIGINKANEEDKNLYLVPITEPTEKSFKLIKAGDYYYLYIKNILRELKIEYKNETVIFEIEQVEQNDRMFYKLERRIKK